MVNTGMRQVSGKIGSRARNAGSLHSVLPPQPFPLPSRRIYVLHPALSSALVLACHVAVCFVLCALTSRQPDSLFSVFCVRLEGDVHELRALNRGLFALSDRGK